MPRKNNIRWKQSDHDALNKAIKNYNAKLARISKKDPDVMQHMPVKAVKKDLLEHIETRGDFRRTLTNLQKFTERGAEQLVHTKRGLTLTEWHVGMYKRGEAAANRDKGQRRKKLQEMEMMLGGQGQGYKRVQMIPEDQAQLKPTKRDPRKMSQREWFSALNHIDNVLDPVRHKQMQDTMRENYIKALTNANILDVDPDLVNLVKAADFDTLYEVAKADELGKFEFIYGKEELMQKAAGLRMAWEAALERARK